MRREFLYLHGTGRATEVHLFDSTVRTQRLATYAVHSSGAVAATAFACITRQISLRRQLNVVGVSGCDRYCFVFDWLPPNSPQIPEAD